MTSFAIVFGVCALISVVLNWWALDIMADQKKEIVRLQNALAEAEQAFQIEKSKRVVLKPEPRR